MPLIHLRIQTQAFRFLLQFSFPEILCCFIIIKAPNFTAIEMNMQPINTYLNFSYLLKNKAGWVDKYLISVAHASTQEKTLKHFLLESD